MHFRLHPRQHCRVGKAIACAVLAILHAALGGMATAVPVGGIGGEDRLVVRGLRQIDPERLRRALVDDPDLVWLSRPSDSREDFVAAVVDKATLALERAGFYGPKVRANVESSDGVERLVLEVDEGERFIAGRIEVSGLPEETATRLVRFLSERQPPLDAALRSVDLSDGTSASTWVDSGGRPAKLLDPEWVPGEPAACDAIAGRAFRTAVARFLRDEGYLAIAPMTERKSAGKLQRGMTYTVRTKWIDASGTHEAFDIALRRADGVADLVVTIKDLPPKATLRDIELPATCRTSKKDLVAFLGIPVGKAVSERDRIEWRDRLRRSARFLRHEIEFRTDPQDPAAVVARFDLEEYPRATPLAEMLSREEATMLRFREWLVAAIGSGDLIVDVRRLQADPTPAGATARLVMSSVDGFVLAVQPDADPACGLIASGTQVSLSPPGGKGRLDMPVPPRTRLTATISLSLSRDATAAAEHPKFNRNLSVGCGVAGAADSGVAIEMQIEPVACLAMVHEGDPKVSFDGDTLVLEANGTTSRFDSASGRPLNVALAGCEISIETKAGAVAAAAAALRHASGPNQIQEEAPVASAIDFLMSDGVAEACGRLAAVAGLPFERTQADDFLRIAALVRGCLDRCRADGGIARCDRAVVAMAAGGDAAEVEPLEIPREEESRSARSIKNEFTRQIAALAWQVTEDHCGRESWPASLVRAAACGMVGDPAIFREMTDFMSQEGYGPLAYACAATLAPVPTVAKSLALRGQERLSTIAFHTDCRPLLRAIDRYGLEGCCVSVLRSIDDESARAIAQAACGDAEMLLPLVRELRAHGTHDQAVDAMQSALDAWWETSLRRLVAARLDAIATPRTAASPAGGEDKSLKK